MKKIIPIILIALSLIACNKEKKTYPVMKSDWQLMFSSDDGDNWYVDQNSITDGAEKHVWIKIEKDSTKTVTLWQFNCLKNTVKSLEMIGYKNNKVMPSGLFDKTDKTMYIVPDSLMKVARNYICSNVRQ